MAFPVTINAGLSSAELPGKYGPYLHLTNRYEILIKKTGSGDTTACFLSAWKSTDSGATWTQFDAANGPQVATFLGATDAAVYTCTQLGTKIYCFFSDPVGGFSRFIAFDMATDLWGSLLANVTMLAVVQSGNSFYTAIARTNDIVVIAPGNIVVVSNIVHTICSFAIYTIAGNTWSAWVDMGYSDYGTLTDWNQYPNGIALDSAGNVVSLMCQLSLLPPAADITIFLLATGTWTVPADCTAIKIECWGAGAGAGSTPICGGGGAGAYARYNVLNVTPAAIYNITVGVASAVGVDGAATQFHDGTLCKAVGGKAGLSHELGGIGGNFSSCVGDVRRTGGNGGLGRSGAGGGGGGSPTALVNGGNGGDGGTGLNPVGGPGGTGEGPGGDGATFGVTTAGGDGTSPGGGGGGSQSIGVPIHGTGARGEIRITYTPVRNTNNSRLFQQRITPANALGALTEIAIAAFPTQSRLQPSLPLSLDIVAGTGFLALAATGTNDSTLSNIAVGRGVNANPVVFALTNLSVGAADSDSTPALAIDSVTSNVYLVYRAFTNYKYRVDQGMGFGGAGDIGTFGTVSRRLQAAFFLTSLEITFGTPTPATVLFEVGG